MTRLAALAAIHARHGAEDVELTQAVAPDLPDGWSIVTRRWAFRCWDALIQGPADGPMGWRLDGDFAPSRRKATRRAVTEIRAYLAAQRVARGELALFEVAP